MANSFQGDDDSDDRSSWKRWPNSNFFFVLLQLPHSDSDWGLL
jgi:hypothetical protein